MLKDRYVQEATALFKSVTLALVGIGAVEPSKLLAASGNVFSAQELKSLSERGAVGDICLRFFDAHGAPVVTPLNERVIAIELAELKRVNRVVGIAGGRRKTAAIRGALRGRLDQHADHRPQHRGAARQEARSARSAAGTRDRRRPERAEGMARSARDCDGAGCRAAAIVAGRVLAILRPWTIGRSRPRRSGVRRRRLRGVGVAAAVREATRDAPTDVSGRRASQAPSRHGRVFVKGTASVAESTASRASGCAARCGCRGARPATVAIQIGPVLRGTALRDALGSSASPTSSTSSTLPASPTR